jgi:predicted nucleic acid-binding protein
VIAVDSSVWVDYFNGRVTRETDLLDRLMGRERLLVGDLILAEVLQGFHSEAAAAIALNHFEAYEFRPMAGREIAIAAAGNYRNLRRRGITLRSTIDALIATFCIAGGHDLLHNDCDFDPFERYLGLRVIRG